MLFKSVKFSVLSLIVLSMAFTSCSLINQSDFAKQKYTNFKSGHHTVNAKSQTKETTIGSELVQTEDKRSFLSSLIEINKEVKNDFVIIELSSASESVHPLTVKESVKKNIAYKKTFIKKATETYKSKSLKKASPFAKMDSVWYFIGVFLFALILPPLAVYQLDGFTNPFVIDLILWIFGIGLVAAAFFTQSITYMWGITFYAFAVAYALYRFIIDYSNIFNPATKKLSTGSKKRRRK